MENEKKKCKPWRTHLVCLSCGREFCRTNSTWICPVCGGTVI